MLWRQLRLQVRHKHRSCRKGNCISKSIHREKWGPRLGTTCALFCLHHWVRQCVSWQPEPRVTESQVSSRQPPQSLVLRVHWLIKPPVGTRHIPASVCFVATGIFLGIVTHTYWMALQVYEKEQHTLLQQHFQAGLTSTLFFPPPWFLICEVWIIIILILWLCSRVACGDRYCCYNSHLLNMRLPKA